MQSLDPLWTEPVKLRRRTVDPLGLARVSDWATEELVPGITTVTTVARNYSFYSWMIRDLGLSGHTTNRLHFAKEFVKRESSLVLASMLHEKGHQEGRSPLGKERGQRFLDNAKGGKVRVDFSPSESNPLGFYGLYYRNAMRKLGLTRRGQVTDQLTPLGNTLASAFEANVKAISYYARRNAESQTLTDLKRLAERCCICRLESSSGERDLLTDILFAKNLPGLTLEQSRRESLLMVLSIIEACSEHEVNLDDDVFRDVVFFSQFRKGSEVIDYNHARFEDVWKRWRVYQLHEFFGYATECLLTIFVRSVKQRDMTFDEFMATQNSLGDKILGELTLSNRPRTWKELLEEILRKCGLDGLSRDNCVSFNSKRDLRSHVNERTLTTRVSNSLDEGHLSDAAAQGAAIIALTCVRGLAEIDSLSGVNTWFLSRAVRDFSIFSFLALVRRKWALEVSNFVREIFMQIIQQHDIIAYEKMQYGNDTFRFVPKGSKYSFKLDVEPNFRSSRIYTMMSLLGDLGLIRERRGVLTLTQRGQRILKDG